MYNLSLPRLSANYYGLPTTEQLRAAHESRCSLFGVSRSTAQVLYCTCLEWYILLSVGGVSLKFRKILFQLFSMQVYTSFKVNFVGAGGLYILLFWGWGDVWLQVMECWAN